MLFDLVVRNPNDPETLENQAFLEISAGYWLRLARASDTDCIGKLLAQFASISRDLLAADTRRSISPQCSEEQALGSLQQLDVQAGIGIQGPFRNRDIDLGLLYEGTNSMNQSEEVVQGVDSTLTDQWYGNWGFGEQMSWIDIIGTPILQ